MGKATDIYKAKTDVSRVLTSQGYKKLGEGIDASVWKKHVGKVMKTMVHEDAIKSFFIFLAYCLEHKENPYLPKIYPKDNNRPFDKFLVGNPPQEFYCTEMEFLKPLKEGTVFHAFVWYIDDQKILRHTFEYTIAKMKKEVGPWKWYVSEIDKNKLDPVYMLNNLTPHEEKNLRGLFETAKDLFGESRKHRLSWDMHTENVMMRADGTPVITDPWILYK